MPWATRKPGGGSLIKWHPQFQSHIYQVLVGRAVRTLLLILLFTEFSTLNLALVLVLGIHNGKTPSLTIRNSSCGQGARHVIKQLHYTHTHTHTHTQVFDRGRQGIHNKALSSDLEAQTRKASWRRWCLIWECKLEPDLVGTHSGRRLEVEPELVGEAGSDHEAKRA